MLARTYFSDGEKQCSLKICTACKNDFSKEVKKAREVMTSLFFNGYRLSHISRVTRRIIHVYHHH